MATAYPIVPADWLDGLGPLNLSLEAYHRILVAWIRQASIDGVPPDPDQFLSGLCLLFDPILDGYKSIYSQVMSAREIGMVGIAEQAPLGEFGD